MSDLKRETWFKCDNTGFRVGLVVIGDKGAIQFWFSAFPAGHDKYGRAFTITPIDLGYHAKEKQYDSQEPMSDKCDILGVPCYYDGTSVGASDLWDKALSVNQDLIWQKLEEVYADRFEAKVES